MVTVVAACGPHFVKVPRCDGGWKLRGEETMWEPPQGRRGSCCFGPRWTGSEEPGNGQVLGPSLHAPFPSPACHLAPFVPAVEVQLHLPAFFSGRCLGDSRQSRSSLSGDSKLLQNVPHLLVLIPGLLYPSHALTQLSSRLHPWAFPGL